MTAAGVTVADIVPEAARGERFHSLRRALGVESFGMNLMLLEPGQQGRIHMHERQEEVYLVWEGSLTVAFGPDEELTAARGQVVRVAPEVRRRLLNRGSELCAVIALGGAGEHAGRDGVAFEDWDSAEGRAPQEVPLPADL